MVRLGPHAETSLRPDPGSQDPVSLKYGHSSHESSKSRIFDGVLNPSKPPTNTTFFIDSDADDSESEAGDSYAEPSPVESLESLGQRSSTTTVSPKSSHTSHSASVLSSGDFAWQTYDAPAELPADSAQPVELSTDEPPKATEDVETQIRSWTTQQVAVWMYNSGFETALISSFLTHDISGAILLDLRFEDLRELDIVSFGKRLQIWNEISGLRCEEHVVDPFAAAASQRPERGGCTVVEIEASGERHKRPNIQRAPGQNNAHSRKLDENVPKPHRCSKGKRCPKWRQQQEMISAVDQAHGPMTPSSTHLDKSFDFPAGVSSNSEPLASQERGRVSSKIVTAEMDDETFLKQLQQPQASSRVKQYLQLQHIVGQVHEVPGAKPQHSASSPASPETPKGDVFLPHQNKPAESFPPRFSSLNTVPPPDSHIRPNTPNKHTPSPSESSIHVLRRDESPAPSETHSRSSSAPPARFLPQTTTTPNRPPAPRSVTAHAAPISGSPMRKPGPGQRLRSNSSDSDLRGTPGAILPNFEIPANSNGSPLLTQTAKTAAPRPNLKSAASDASLPRKRPVQPLPTLVERNSKVEVDKSLPPTPAKSVSSAESVVPPLPTFNAAGTLSIKPESASSKVPVTPERTTSAPNSRSVTPQPLSRGPSPGPIVAPPIAPASTERKASVTPAGDRKPSIIVPPAPSVNTSYPLSAYGADIIRVGWVRRRRSKLWRHEWTAVHLRLTSKTIAIYATAKPEDATPLETIDMDEYTIACSTGNGSNKLAAAVRSLRLGASSSSSRSASPGSGSLDGDHGASFAWQLVPKAAIGEAANVKSVRTEKDRDGEEKTTVVGARDEARVLKTHNFAVATRDERIEWMRQAMLAQALRAKALGRRTERTPRGSQEEAVFATTAGDSLQVKRCEARPESIAMTLEAVA